MKDSLHISCLNKRSSDFKFWSGLGRRVSILNGRVVLRRGLAGQDVLLLEGFVVDAEEFFETAFSLLVEKFRVGSTGRARLI